LRPSPTQRNTVGTGQRGEEFVCDRLIERGLRVVARNVREKFAEIDIVAQDGDTLVFIEVRTRQDDALGHPAETITPAKQQKIRRAAEAYLSRRRITGRAVRFDVATIVWRTGAYDYFENAF